MKKNNDYRFYVYTDEMGNNTPLFEFFFEPNLKLNHLISLSNFLTSDSTQKMIHNFDEVISKKINNLNINVEDALTLFVTYDRIVAEDLIQLFGYDKVDKTEHSTTEFLSFLKEWKEFLMKYENNEIPNLNNPNSRKK